ncbi:MAG: ATP-binding protein [Turneriella sp.]|nr:ATP-binding protein [Turneriella sp.]
MAGRIATLWEKYLTSGQRHFSTATEIKLNRVLNLLLSLPFLANAFLIVVELIIFYLLLRQDYNRYIGYFFPFAIANTVFTFLIIAIIWVKNRTGSFRVTYLSTLTYTCYCVLLSFYLGEKIHFEMILFSVLPVVFIIYEFGMWFDIFVHTAIMVAGFVACLGSYKYAAPLYPIPPDIAEIGGYLCWFVAFGLLFIYSVYNWKQVHLTERLLAREKNQTQELLNETIPKLEMAEAKYRHLVDDSSDMIFQMNPAGELLSMNKTARTLLGFNPEEMVGQKLYDFIPDGLEGDPNLNRGIVREHMRALDEGNKLVTFRTTLRKKHMYEPVDVQVTLQKPDVADSAELIGKISRIEQDISQRFLEKEKGRYIIANNVTQAEILSQKLTERLARFFTPAVVNTIRICFREILVNAIEHGNLGITFEEKTRAIEKSDYMEFLLARQKESKYAARRVYIDYLINGRALMFRVTDEGDGFDHTTFLERAKSDPYLAMLEHGRGIIMTRNVFDTVTFNEKGNQVILTKRIPR